MESPSHIPKQIIRNQIYYVNVNQLFRNSIKSVKAYPGADIHSDHQEVKVLPEMHSTT